MRMPKALYRVKLTDDTDVDLGIGLTDHALDRRNGKAVGIGNPELFELAFDERARLMLLIPELRMSEDGISDADNILSMGIDRIKNSVFHKNPL